MINRKILLMAVVVYIWVAYMYAERGNYGITILYLIVAAFHAAVLVYERREKDRKIRYLKEMHEMIKAGTMKGSNEINHKVMRDLTKIMIMDCKRCLSREELSRKERQQVRNMQAEFENFLRI